MNNAPKHNSSKKKNWDLLSLLKKTFLGLVLVFVVLVLLIRMPCVQHKITTQITGYLSEKTNTKISIDRLLLTFKGHLKLDGVYFEDKKGDTLIYSKSLEAGIAIWPLITNGNIGISSIDWQGVKATVTRKDTISSFNFQFIADAFATPSTTQTEPESDTPPNISLGVLTFKDIHIIYQDDVTGIDSKFDIGLLKLDVDTFNLQEMISEVAHTQLEHSYIKFHQNPIAEIDPEEDENITLPNLAFNTINLEAVTIDYAALESGLSAKTTIGVFNTKLPRINLAENTINVAQFHLANSSVAVNTTKNVTSDTTPDINNTPSTAFKWPDFNVAVKDVALNHNRFSYTAKDASSTKNTFNPDAIALEDVSLEMPSLYLKNRSAGIAITSLNFKDVSGLSLKNFETHISATDEYINVENLKIALNANRLEGNLNIKYNTLSNFIANPNTADLALNLQNFSLNTKDALLVQPELKNNPSFTSLSSSDFQGMLNAEGSLASLKILKSTVAWGNSTQMLLENSILKHVAVPDSLEFSIPTVRIKTSRADLFKFADLKNAGINVPKNIETYGSLKGNLNTIDTNLKVVTTQGNATIKGKVDTEKDIAFNTKIAIKNYDLGALLQNEKLGVLSAAMESTGKGTSLNTIDANLKAVVSKFSYNNYAINDLNISGALENGKGNVTSTYKDTNLNLGLNAAIVADSIAPQVTIDLNLEGANLQGLGLVKRDVRTALKLEADFKGNAENYDVKGRIKDGVVVYDKQTYLLGRLDAAAFVRTDTTSLYVKNRILDLELESNTDPETFGNALQSHIASYFYRDESARDSISTPVQIKMNGKISQAPLLKEVFFVNIEDLDTIALAVDFNSKANRLNANITAPHINYSGNEIDSLAFTIATNKNDFNFDLGFKAIKAGPISINRTNLTGLQRDNELDLEFLSFNENEKLMHIQSQITGTKERLGIRIRPEDFILNKALWDIPTDNEIIYTEQKLAFNNFKIKKNEQSITLTDTFPNLNKEHISIIYDNFKLKEILDYLNPDQRFADGTLNGDFIFIHPFTDTGVIADLVINNLKVMDVPLGTFTTDAEALGGSKYTFKANTKGGDITLDLNGNYTANTTDAVVDLNLDISRFNMNALERFSLGEISNTSGFFKGNFKIEGTTATPKYTGELNFKDATFEITKFNTPFTLQNETLTVDNQGLSMERFTLLDKNKNTLTLSGTIGTKTFINPTFNLAVKAKNFQILNATEKDNDFLYGTAAFDADAKLTGDLQIPKVNLKATITPSTNVTYVMPSATVNLEENNGIVAFVNRENPNAILTETEAEVATVSGFDVAALVKIGEGAKVKVIIDKTTNDNFQASGLGDFNFTMRPNGRMNLVGTYKIKDGHYEMNLYNIVNRTFKLVEGSTISWSGDPFDANLDVKALYNVDASASALMAAQTSGLDPTAKGKFRQVLPFYVYLNVNGELLQPKITFNLDMPEDEQGAIGGQVYGRLQQLNQQEAELNKHVFSLLVLNRFYPEPGSDGSTGGAATAARNNLNDALSDQLNVFSDKILGDTGIELNFGLDSYTDYQGSSPTERTELDIAAQKKLFNDKLIVRVGSEVGVQGGGNTAPVIGNVSLEYILTEDGRYRLKGFRRNEFENVIDGQTITNGIAIIFTQEFNKFSELKNALFFKKLKKEAASKATETEDTLPNDAKETTKK